jgi:ABC-type glycerol-3-phosphate transport system substrate-binding protein
MDTTMTLNASRFDLKGRKLLLALTGSVLVLAACGGGAPLSGINSLGQAFVSAFNQAPNSAPVQNVQSLPLTLTPTATPFNP